MVEEAITTDTSPMGDVSTLGLVSFDPTEDVGGSCGQLGELALSVLSLVVSKEDPEGRADEAEFFGYRITNEVLKVVRHEVLTVDEQEEGRRSSLDLHQVAHFEPSSAFRRHPLDLLEGMQPLIEESGRHPSVPLLIHSQDFIHHAALPLASLSRDETDRDPLGLSKTLLELLLHPLDCLFLVFVFDEVPFIGNDDDGATLIQHSPDQSHICRSESFQSVDHHRHNV